MKSSFAKTMFLFLFALCAATFVKAQAINNDTLKAQLLKDWNRAKAYTQAYLNTMPAEKYSLKPVDSIRSFAQQMLHLAQANIFIGAAATGQPAPAFGMRELENASSAQSKDSVAYFVNSSYDFVIDGISKLDASKLGESATAFGVTTSKYIWLLKVFEHQTHHRGQTTIYIRLAGIKPPGEMLF